MEVTLDGSVIDLSEVQVGSVVTDVDPPAG